MNTCKMNVTYTGSGYEVVCTNCGHHFSTSYAENPYAEMCWIAKGKYKFCPNCGAKYMGCQIEGTDFKKCKPDMQDYVNRGLKG